MIPYLFSKPRGSVLPLHLFWLQDWKKQFLG